MADPNEAPSPAALREMADAIESWLAHRLDKIFDAREVMNALRACATALEVKDREIARLDAMRSLKCPHGWLYWECLECIRAYGKEPKP